jgi:hypothetical protein
MWLNEPLRIEAFENNGLDEQRGIVHLRKILKDETFHGN